MPKPRMALLTALASAALVALLGTSAIPAAAAPAMGAATANPIGSIVCGGDVCIQTQSANISNCTAVVAAWANTTTFFGHFEIVPLGPTITPGVNSPGGDKTWPAGGTNVKITIPFYGSPETYQAIAWKRNANGSHTKIGTVNFTINVPSFC